MAEKSLGYQGFARSLDVPATMLRNTTNGGGVMG